MVEPTGPTLYDGKLSERKDNQVMAPARRHSAAKWLGTLALLALGLAALLPAGLAWGAKKAARHPVAALDSKVPEGVDDLRALERRVKKVLKKVLRATVSVRVGGAQGSGVIVRKDGTVLTAAHVSGKPGQKAVVIFSDGKTVHGKTLGSNRTADSGMIKITDKGPWPFVELGDSSDLHKGQWCIAVGHPGGFREGRSPVVRLGRVLEVGKLYFCTDCTLVGGDSGGPVFDLSGRVVGIHSCIGSRLIINIHVPVNTYRQTWDRLAKSESWGKRPSYKKTSRPYFGVEGGEDEKECRITHVTPGSPAEKAGLKEGDVVVKFDGREVASFAQLSAEIRKTRPGERVFLEVVRDKETLFLEVVVGKRGN
jgi:serine protease Do